MSRPLLASGLTLVLLGGILAAWWFAGAPAPADQAVPGPVTASRSAGDADDLLGIGAESEARRAPRSTDGSESVTVGAPGHDGGAALAIEVAVVDPHGSAVAGARVRSEYPVLSEVDTDEHGLARLELPSGTSSVELWVDAEGYAHARELLSVSARVEVTLHHATRARGRVIELVHRSGLENANVWLDDDHEGCEPRITRTATDGSFELDEVPVGARFTVRAAADGFADGGAPYQLLDQSERDGLEIALKRSATVRLRIVDFLTARPVPGAKLLSLPGLTPADEGGLIDASRLVAESSEAVWIAVAAPGYCRLRRQLDSSEWSEGGLATIPLLAGARFEGVVRDGTGAPVAGAEVALRQPDRSARTRGELQGLEGWQPSWVLISEHEDAVTTDLEGRFVTAGVPPTTEGWELKVSAPGRASAHVEAGRAAEPGHSSWIEVQLSPSRTGTISGRLTLNGAAIGGTVTWSGATSEGQGMADPAGGFRLTGVEAGPVSLGASPVDGAQRYGTLLDGVLVSLELEAGEEIAQDIELTLPLATTTGHVRTQRGNGIEGVEVVATLGNRRAAMRTTSLAEGRFELELPALPETWTLQVRGPWRTELVEALAGDRDIVLVVTELGRLRLRVVDATDGRPLRDFTVRGSVAGAPGSRILAGTWLNSPDPAGWVEFEAPSGTVDLVAQAFDSSYSPAQAQVLVPPAGAPAASVEIFTARGRTLALVLAEGSDRPPRRARMYLLDEDVAARLSEEGTPEERWATLVSTLGNTDSLRSRRVAFDRQGWTTLVGLSDGRYRLVDLGRGRFEPAQVVIPRDAGATVEVRWEDVP